jgi:metal-sulfur cluster biosynthetic enzyme
VDQVKIALEDVPGVQDVRVQFDVRPAWSPALLSDSARHELEITGLLPTTTWLG